MGQRQAEPLGLPAGFKVGSALPFGGLNVSDGRTALQDQEFSWLENYVRIGKGRMRAVPDKGPALVAAPPGLTIAYFFWFNIGPRSLCAVFLSDGTAMQVDTSGGTIWISSTPGTFLTAGNPPTCSPWGTQYLLIANNITPNAYWVWDGTLLYAPGSISPVIILTSGGSNYSSPPTVTAFGGSGSGATFTATVENGSVVSVVPNSPGSGYGPSDVVQLLFTGGGTDNGAELVAVLANGSVTSLTLTNGGSGYTSPPAVTLTGGGGSGAAATATLAPAGVSALTLNTGGSGYTSAPNVLLVGGGGTGATAACTVTAGAVTTVFLTNAGSGYTSRPTVLFQGGGGTGASATANLSGAPVASLTLTNGGSGYTGTPTVGFTSGGGTGATAAAVITPGSVTAVNVINGGTGFTGTPLLTFVGGGGSGAAASATVTAGAISSVAVTNGGSDYTSAPAVEVQPGVNRAATATVELMPIGVSGNALEVFQSRVWLFHNFQAGPLPSGGNAIVSAPGSLTDFATSDGGLAFSNTDRFLRAQYTAARQANGYLYLVGDSSVGVVSNVQTSGNPPTTSFNNLNTDPQTGSSWRDSLADFSRTILFGNPFGAWGIYGGAVTKISKKLDLLFDTAQFPPMSPNALTPTSAVTQLYGQRIFLMLMTILDPFTAEPRNAMIGWDETDWCVLSQSANLTMVGTQEVNSDPQAWGTDGATLFPLFTNPSASLPKTLQTKFYGAETAFLVEVAYAIYVTAQIKAAGVTQLEFETATIDAIGTSQPINLPEWMEAEVPQIGGSTSMNTPVSFAIPSGQVGSFGVGCDPPVAGVGVGMTLVTHNPDFELVNLQLGYIDVAAVA
jgi:hypothetical protein